MEEAISKANILIEALPYIRKFHKAIFLIKYGGSILTDPDARKAMLEDIVFLRYAGIKPIIVHGGGPYINKELEKLNHPVQFKNGLRVTDDITLKVVLKEMEKLNKLLVDEINTHGDIAHGFTKKNCLISAKKKKTDVELGFVGDAVDCDMFTLKAVLNIGVPVIGPIGIDDDGTIYNINADDVAYFLASKLKAEKLVLLTKERGVLMDQNDDSTLIHSINVSESEKYIEDGIITAGMVPKIRAAVQSIHNGVDKVHIIDARISHALLLEIFTTSGIGTEIVS